MPDSHFFSDYGDQHSTESVRNDDAESSIYRSSDFGFASEDMISHRSFLCIEEFVAVYRAGGCRALPLWKGAFLKLTQLRTGASNLMELLQVAFQSPG